MKKESTKQIHDRSLRKQRKNACKSLLEYGVLDDVINILKNQTFTLIEQANILDNMDEKGAPMTGMLLVYKAKLDALRDIYFLIKDLASEDVD